MRGLPAGSMRPGARRGLFRPSVPIESVGAAQALREQLHELESKMRVLTDKEIELRFVNLDEFRLLEGDRGGRPRGVLTERHLAEDLLLQNAMVRL
jgi:hypothetical protein